jgi:hypothetical protein
MTFTPRRGQLGTKSDNHMEQTKMPKGMPSQPAPFQSHSSGQGGLPIDSAHSLFIAAWLGYNLKAQNPRTTPGRRAQCVECTRFALAGRVYSAANRDRIVLENPFDPICVNIPHSYMKVGISLLLPGDTAGLYRAFISSRIC